MDFLLAYCIVLFQSIEVVGGMLGGLLAWPVSIALGRQTALIVGGIPSLCGWLLMSYSVQITGSRAEFITVILTARVLTGFGAGWASFYVSVSTDYLHSQVYVLLL